MRNLLLLTSDYPYVTGDGNFLINEIDALSKAFDKIYIARKKKMPGVQEHDLPHNAELIFDGFVNRRDILTKGFFNTAKLPLYLFWQDRKDITSLRFFFRFVLSFLFGRALYAHKKIREETDKKAMIYSFWGTGMSSLIPFLSKKKNKVIIRLHGGDLYTNRRGYIPFRKSIYTKANKILTISQDGKNYVSQFLKQHNISTNKLELMRLGTKSYEKAHQLKTFEEKLVVSCSSLIELKRVDLIYKVLLEASKRTKIRWVHFGDGALKDKLMQQITPTDQLIIDFKGNQPNQTIISFYQTTKIDLFINLSASEGIPVSIMEAISFDIPVLATDAGGTREIIQEKHKTGILVPVNFNTSEVASLIVNLLNNNTHFSPKHFWSKHYNRDNNNKKLVDLLYSL